MDHIVGIVAHAVADHLGVDARAARLGDLQFFQNDDAAPSPRMKPSRPVSKGREACSGSSLRRDMARMLEKPAMEIGVMAASRPPAIMASASPRWMTS